MSNPVRVPNVLRAVALTIAALAAACVGVGCGKSGTIAEVDGVKLSRSAWERRMRAERGAEALVKIVDRMLVEEAAKEKGIEVDEDRVRFKLEQKEIEAGGREELERRLGEGGRTYEELRADLEHEALAEQAMAAEVSVSEEDVEQYYEERPDEFRHGEMVKGRFMLLESRENAEAIMSVLDDPEADFAGLATELSSDPGTKDDGGDMGWVERRDYTSEIADAAFACEVGKYTEIIEYADGFGIVLVEDKKPGGIKPLEDVRKQVEAAVRRVKEAELRPGWAAQQRAKADIKVLAEDLKEPFERIRGR